MTTNKKDGGKYQGKFEFTIYLNNNIIVQRYFPVIGFNETAVKSLNFKDAVDFCVDTIMYHLRDKTLDYMNDYAKFFYEDPNFDRSDNNDIIKVIVKSEHKEIAYREINANLYPSKVRYTIDVRPHIYDMITQIQKSLSEKTDNLELTYLNYNLNV